uniref:Uncharacterized protein n=1 Tax=Anguilla anguilla TaxID=7936 RepID=A0A0E9WK80_ANGAN
MHFHSCVLVKQCSVAFPGVCLSLFFKGLSGSFCRLPKMEALGAPDSLHSVESESLSHCESCLALTSASAS